MQFQQAAYVVADVAKPANGLRRCQAAAGLVECLRTAFVQLKLKQALHSDDWTPTMLRPLLTRLTIVNLPKNS